MKNRIYAIILIICIFSILYIFTISNVNCVFKSITHLSCPACGLTRAFISLYNLNIISALKYNILLVPILVMLIISLILLVFDIIFGTDKCIKLYNRLFTKYYVIIFIALIISMVYNNIMNI